MSKKSVESQISFSDIISWVCGLKPKYFGCNRNFPFITKKQNATVLVVMSEQTKRDSNSHCAQRLI